MQNSTEMILFYNKMGILFYDRINDSPYKHTGEELIATNPCSEQPLPPNGSCNLGSIDISKLLNENNEFDWDKFELIIRYGMRFLDAVIDRGQFPTSDIEEWAQTHRAVGLGIMGYADLLLMKEIAYGSQEAVQLLEDILSFMDIVSVDESEKMGSEFGVPEKCQLLSVPRRNVTTTTIAPTGCQKPETIISTDSGLYRLSEIVDTNGPTWQDISLNVYQEDGCSLATKAFINGKSKTKKILLSSGIELECTPHHRYKIIREGSYEWCRADNLMIGDIIPSKIGWYSKKSEPKLKTNSYVKKGGSKAKTISLPEYMSPDLAFFIGCFYADGSVHKRGIRIHQNALDKDKISKIIGVIKKVFNCESVVEINNTCVQIYINSVVLLPYLKTNGLLKEKSLNVSIPKKIRESSLDSIKAFVAGYYMCDGHSSGSYKAIDTVSYQMAQDLGVILRAIGENVRIKKSDKIKGHIGKNPMYRIYFGGYGSLSFPKEKDRYVSIEKRSIDNISKELAGEDFVGDTVESISDGVALTYDISVPYKNMYIANGVVSHNTISLIAGCSSGIEPIFSEITVRNDKTGTYTFENDLAEKPYFRCAVSSNGSKEVTWEEHVQTLASSQKYIQSGVSKTINFPNNIKRESIANAVITAWQKGCKGVAVYRNGSRKVEVLSPKNVKKDRCPVCGNDMVEINGEKRCVFCKKEVEGTSSYYD